MLESNGKRQEICPWWSAWSLIFLVACSAAPKVEPRQVGAPMGSKEQINGAILAQRASLAELLERGGTTAIDLVLIDARSRGDYLAGHLPGAVTIPWDELAPQGKLSPASRLVEIFSLAGVDRDAHLVVYDHGGLDARAARLFWLLEYLGCQHVQLLEGGIEGWRASHLAIERNAVERARTSFVPELRSALRANREQVVQAQAEPGRFLLIDARDDGEVIGWPSPGQDRGGRLAGAIQVSPASFIDLGSSRWRSSRELRELLERIPVDRRLIIYSARGMRSSLLYVALRLHDRAQALHYDEGLADWLAAGGELQAMPRWELLVDAKWVSDVLAGKPPVASPPRGEVRLVAAMRGKSATQYLPRAQLILADELFAAGPANVGQVLPPAELGEWLARHGIRHDTTVVVYGPLNVAARVVWAMLYAGVVDVRYLNGGLNAWCSQGGQTQSTPTMAEAVAEFGATIPGRPELMAAMARLQASEQQCVAIRSWPEHIGQLPDPVSGVRGRIIGSIWGLAGRDAFSVEDFEDADGTLRSLIELATLWRAQGIDPARPVTFYSGSGWRAAVGFMCTYVMGWANVATFDGGWRLWIRPGEEDRPIEVGVPFRKK